MLNIGQADNRSTPNVIEQHVLRVCSWLDYVNSVAHSWIKVLPEWWLESLFWIAAFNLLKQVPNDLFGVW